MARIPRVDPAGATGKTAEVFQDFIQERGKVPNMFRTVAHRPELLETMVAHFRAVMKTGTCPPKFKELAIVRESQINKCDY